MCPGSCAVFLCSDCQKAARDDKRAAANYATLLDAVCATSTSVEDACRQARDTRAQAEAHVLRCQQLEKEVAKAKHAELESDRQLREALAKIAGMELKIQRLEGVVIP